jgi:hypothetical protein
MLQYRTEGPEIGVARKEEALLQMQTQCYTCNNSEEPIPSSSLAERDESESYTCAQKCCDLILNLFFHQRSEIL